MTTLELFDSFCPAPSYDAWREVIRAVDGLAPANLETWNRISGNRPAISDSRISELYAAVGRGAGKSQAASTIAVSRAVAYRRKTWFSQRPFVGLFGRDQRQADELMNYVRQLFEHPSLRPLVAGDPAKRTLTLKSGVRIEVLPADWRKVRSRGYLCAVIDEAAFLDSDEHSAQQDVELLRALRPALGRIPGSLLVVISSKHARRGILFEASKLLGVDDPHTLYVQGGTLDFNPTFDPHVIERAYREDPTSAASEFGTAWREDVAGLFTLEAITAVTTKGCIERPPDDGITYRAFVDFAGGSGSDSAAVAVAHTDRLTKHDVLDAILEVPPPFSPATVCADFAELLHRYRVTTVTADRWGAQFVVEGMGAHGIRVEQSAMPKSDIYLLALPLINSGLLDLLDDQKLARQAVRLERRAGGSVDHPPRMHDDRVNAAFGALVCGRAASGQQYRIRLITPYDERESEPVADDCPIPVAIRGNADAVMQWLVRHEPTIAAADDPLTALAELWQPLAVAGLVPKWDQTVSRIAAVRLRTGAINVAA